MPERHGYAPGVPSWVDIGTDVEAAKKFYGTLFGWQAQEAGPVEETGGYGMFLKNGKMVAGYGPQQNPGPPFWTTYIATDDAEAIAAKVKENGGQVIMDPMDVMTAGRMAVFQDPEGAFVSVWQAGEHKGAQLVNEPGSLSWNELNTRDLEGAKRFYGAVFGWDFNTETMGEMSYTEIKLDGNPVGGINDMTGKVPEQVPPHWLAYFSVDDTDGTVSKTQELGGSVMVPPIDIPAGRFSVLGDDKGAFFAVIKLAPQS